MELEEYTLKDLLSRIVDNRGRTCPTAETGTALIATNCVKDNQLYPVFENVRWVDSETMKTWFRGHPEPGDILFVLKGSPGRCCLVPDPINFCIAQDMLALRADESKVSQKFLFALLRSNIVRNAIDNLHVGTMIPHFKKGDFDKLKFQIPKSRKIQEWIGDQYFTLSDKIELNRRMNATLEGMAQALFKSWFVDFDPVIDNALAAGNPIPDELAPRAEVRRQALSDQKAAATQQGSVNDSTLSDRKSHFPAAFQLTEELGWIPEGWEVKQVKDFGHVVCGKTPSKSNPDYYGKDVPFIKIPDMHHSAWITETTDGLSFAGADSQNKKQIPSKSISVSCIATVGKVIITSESSHTNQQINSVIPRAEQSRYYLYFTFLEKNKELHDLASGGSATLNLNTGSFSKIELISPPTSALKLYHEATDPLFEKMLASDHESQSLTTLRDTLLPKLISGELQTDDSETLNEEIA